MTTRGGGQLSRRQAFAVRHIVALAVKSLDPGRVTVIDSFNGMTLGLDEGDDGLHGDDARIAREARIRSELEALLAAHVGAGRVRVSVAVETDNETESVTERVFDPEGRVAIHSDTTETTENSVEPAGGGANGAVGVGGNLPEGQGRGGAGAAGSSQKANTSERINYEVSEVRRERRKLAGAIKRISVAVLVDGKLVANADGSSAYQARTAEELATIGKLVRSAIAFNAERGDVVTVENLPFAVSEREDATAPDIGFLGALADNLVDLAEILGLVLIISLLMWFVVRPLTSGRAFEPATQAPLPIGHDAADTGDAAGIEDASFDEVQDDAAEAQKLIEALPTGNPQLLRLHAIVDDKPEETFALLRKWLHETDEEEAA